MNDPLATQGIIIFSILAIALSVLSHTLIKRISLAILIAAITTAITFQIIVYFLAGYIDPFFPIALLTTFVLAFLIALVVSIPFKIWRRSCNDKERPAT
jgi:hypothetical protein